MTIRMIAAALFVVLGASSGWALVLCQKRAGPVFARAACKKKETQLDPIALGLQGPKGDPGSGPLGTCPPDAVLVGTTCVDQFEASVWSIPDTNTALLAAVKAGTATVGSLIDGGASEVSLSPDCAPAFPPSFPRSGNWTAPLYAVSVPGVLPTACVSWFQASQACALAGKRLATNDEWQRAAAGTPDPGTDNLTTDCAVNSPNPVDTGSRSSCRSSWGVSDMVGNLFEWVSDWGDRASGQTDWTSDGNLPGGDLSAYGGSPAVASEHIPGALIRGGEWGQGASAGVFAVAVGFAPSASARGDVGFRCVR